MKSLFAGCIAIVLAIGVAGEAGAKCTDDAAVAAARAQVAATCPCNGFANHGQYVRCARGVARTMVDLNTLPRMCTGNVVSCAARSTCGKPAGAVTCCTTDKRGKTRCSVKKGATQCKAPKGGSACVGTFSSCCDACGVGGCSPATPTPTPAPTPTVAPTPTPTPPPYGSASRAFIRFVASLLQ
jgi:hypothetical protein